MKLMLRQISTMNRPGNQNSHGRVANASWFCEMSSPSDVSGALTPTPR